MSSLEVLFLNAIVYTITLLYFCVRYKLSVGVLIWSMYTLSAWSSFLFVQQPRYFLSGHYSEQTILPCIYLYIVLVIAMAPLMKLKQIENYEFHTHRRLLRTIIIACTIIQLVFVLVDIPSMLKVVTSDTSALTDLRSTLYENQGNTYVTENPWLNRVSLLFSGMRILATGFSIIAFFLYKEDRKLINLFALSALLNNIRMIITSVGRGEMVLTFLLYGCMIYLLKDQLSSKMKKTIAVYGIPVIVLGASFFWAITVSRFGDDVGYFMYKYLGEPMNNFNGILFPNIKGSTNGRAYFSMFYRYFMGGQGFATAYDKWEFIANTTGVRGDIFYTWVGGLIIEFGKVAPFIVAFVFNRMVSRLVRIKKYYAGDIVMLVFFINFYVRGIFFFPTQSFEGNLMIVYTILLYFLFRIRRKKDGKLVYVKPKSIFKS